jgi:MFS family permease
MHPVPDSSPAAARRHAVHPLLFLVQFLPFGASAGFVIVTLGYQLAHRGVPTDSVAGVIALSYVPHTWRFLWAPIVDTTWTRKRWYLAGTALCGGGMCLTGLATDAPHLSLALIGALLVAYNVGATVLSMAVESLVAAIVPDDLRGRTSGWIQAGNLGGQGLGGGLALWLIQGAGWSCGAAAGALAAMCALCCLSLLRLPDPAPVVALHGQDARPAELDLLANAKAIALDLWGLVRSRTGALAVLICFLPIGSGAASNLWSAIAGDWHAGADIVAFVNGAASGLISAAGCLAAGWLCDRFDRKAMYCTFGLLVVACALGMAALPRTPVQFVLWTSLYAFAVGMGYTAYSSVVFEAIGHTAAATKFSLLAALSNVPIQVMTLVDGTASARLGNGGMLLVDAACGAGGVLLFLAVAASTRRERAGAAPGSVAAEA